jgi:DNA-binding HxlR family transcriptional regulator
VVKEYDIKWLSWGSQKQAVIQAMDKPMMPSQILREAKKLNRKISFADLSNLMREFTERGITECLTPRQLTGRIYYLTDYGRQLARRVFALSIPPLDKEFNWNKYALVVAGKTRKLILKELFFLKACYENGITLAAIRKKLSNIYPITLSQTYSATSYLLKARLVRISGYAKLRNSKLYKLTPEGRRICEYMLGKTKFQQNHEHSF